MTPREQEEYSALRATIRERGTARVWVFVAGTTAWAAIAMATSALASSPIAALLPLLVLAAHFEGVYALHIGVERVGRYLRVFHEDGWEQAAMAFGRPQGAAATDPLFAAFFGLAALFNITPSLFMHPTTEELVFVAGGHALFLLRLVTARMAASRQRAIDSKRFEEIRAERDGQEGRERQDGRESS